MSNICQPYTTHRSKLSKNWQICYALHIQIYFPYWTHAHWPRPTSLQPFFYYRIPSHAVQTQHGLYLKPAFLYFGSFITAEPCICIYMMWLTHQILFNVTLTRKLLISFWTFQYQSDLPMLTCKFLPCLGEMKMEALLSIQYSGPCQDVCLHEKSLSSPNLATLKLGVLYKLNV